MSTDLAIQLHALLNPLTEADRAYPVRFAAANADLSVEDFAAKWEQDKADRAGAAALDDHRKEQVISAVASEFNLDKDAVAKILGVQGDGASASFSGDAPQSPPAGEQQ